MVLYDWIGLTYLRHVLEHLRSTARRTISLIKLPTFHHISSDRSIPWQANIPIQRSEGHGPSDSYNARCNRNPQTGWSNTAVACAQVSTRSIGECQCTNAFGGQYNSSSTISGCHSCSNAFRAISPRKQCSIRNAIKCVRQSSFVITPQCPRW